VSSKDSSSTNTSLNFQSNSDTIIDLKGDLETTNKNIISAISESVA
jgi:hypothetical protein